MNFFNKKEFFFFMAFLLACFFTIFFISSEKSFQNNFSEELCVSSVEVYFCPEDFCSSRLISQIDSAEESVFVAIYSFTHEGIANALISAKERDLDVRVVIDFLQSTSSNSVHELLEEKGIPVFVKKGSGIMHNKFIVIDGKKVFTGSFNYSWNADLRNDENLVLIVDSFVVSKFVSKFFELAS